jgi:hypothetical protein
VRANIIFLLLFLALYAPLPVHSYYSATAVASGSLTVLADFEPPTIDLLVNQRVVGETIINGDFLADLDHWYHFGAVSVVGPQTVAEINITPVVGDKMAKLGTTSSNIETSRIYQVLPNTAKNLKLSYFLLSSDHYPFDNPAFLVRLNGRTIYRTNTLVANPNNFANEEFRGSGWIDLEFDLSDYSTDNLTLEIVVSNNGDETRPTLAFVDTVTTDLIASSPEMTYTLIASDSAGVDWVQYRLGGSQWVQSDTIYFPDVGEFLLEYQAQDSYGNKTEILEKAILVTDPSEATSDLMIDLQGFNFVDLSWTAVTETDVLVVSKVYLQPDCDTETKFNLQESELYPDLATSGQSNSTELARIWGLNPGTDYCFGVTLANLGGRESGLSNVVVGQTQLGDNLIRPGDLLINELMWMGSMGDAYDEWIELRNLTTRELNLDSISFSKQTSSGEVAMPINLTGKTIAPKGLFLISRRDELASQLNFEPDLVSSSVSLSNTDLQIKMFSQGVLLDTAGNGGVPTAGLHSINSQYFSMQRAFGFSPIAELNWFTTLDPLTSDLYFDSGAVERGTPKAANH